MRTDVDVNQILVQIESGAEIEYMRGQAEPYGYAEFRQLTELIQEKLKRFDESEVSKLENVLERLQQVFPQPANYSPSWERIWTDYNCIVSVKSKILKSIPVGEREGEWQVLLNNPFTNEDVVVYAGLPFLEAAYLYGYFRKDLKKNEHIRLQKVVSLVTECGE